MHTEKQANAIYVGVRGTLHWIFCSWKQISVFLSCGELCVPQMGKYMDQGLTYTQPTNPPPNYAPNIPTKH